MLQEGVGVEGTVGVDMERFLAQSLRISEGYLRNRIQTIFLNAKPVDDPVSARLFPGDVVALSASLPGLLGAMLRKGGYYAAMRNQISYRDTGNRVNDTRSGSITLKRFHLPAKEIAPTSCDRGGG